MNADLIVRATTCPDDVKPFHRPETAWLEFTTRLWGGKAIVAVEVRWSPPALILHWLEGNPTYAGQGAVLLDAVNDYADRHGLTGWLVCELAVVPFYQLHGWVTIGPYLSLYQMARVPR